MNTLMITTPGMGKSYLVKQLKAAKALAFDFDVKGTKPIGLDEQSMQLCRRANTAFVNHTFEAGYVLGTSWPGAIDFDALNKDIEVIFVLPVINAITGALLRIAARQPGSAFLYDMLDHYTDVADKVLIDYHQALSAGCKARLVQVCRPDWTLYDIYHYGADWAQRQYELACGSQELIPIRSVICKVLGTSLDDINVVRFLDHITPSLATRINISLANDNLHTLDISFLYSDRTWERPSFKDVLSSLSRGETIVDVSERGFGTYTIKLRKLVEADEMGDWFSERYVMLYTNGGDFYA